ncbi:ribonuclease HI [Maridesulfovibrio ferrireducens]|uniref:ribonuclease HI n=1 Tax=Maridesulfovibrio ferrireducens TaxID=246191 RepID=UPI001A2D958D|nr:ribonuclease HI [Maridesulfovibrio ferrireducens]MBI9113185.1 ribonuclease HI [Maridesulfovibrio ferrireducens]
MNNSTKIKIYTDGSCLGNQFKGADGGYGALIHTPNESIELAQGYRTTTNNRMELRAVIAALLVIPPESDVTLYSDSKYVIDAFVQGWLNNWIKSGWRKSNRKPVENQDLWKELLENIHGHNIRWEWVRGHSGNQLNGCADILARVGASGNNKMFDDVGLTIATVVSSY